MKASKKTIAGVVILLLIQFCLSGCQLFTEGKKRLHLYCPGLNIGINGVSYSGNGEREVYVLSYDPNVQKQVQTYFEQKENNFTGDKDDSLYKIIINNAPVIDPADRILGKTISRSRGNALVIFNETRQTIIIIENLK